MSDDILQLEQFLPYRLNRLADPVSREFSTIYRDRHGLTRPEWRTLATIGQFGTLAATAIGAHSAMHKTKVSRAIFALESRKWLLRRTDDRDRRVEHLTLTAAGRKVYEDLLPFARNFETSFLAALNAEERAAMLRGLALLEKAAGVQSRTQPARITSRGS
jgi:DNA-binding MarR family transcriptional regulator